MERKENTVKNCIDMPIFHRAICAENVTNKPLSDKRNCIRRFLLRFLEKTFSEWRILWDNAVCCGSYLD